jgi:hypothetical protein
LIAYLNDRQREGALFRAVELDPNPSTIFRFPAPRHPLRNIARPDIVLNERPIRLDFKSGSPP